MGAEPEPRRAKWERAGWEEVTDASVTYLLRSVLAKGGKDVGAIPHSMQVFAVV